MQPLLEDVDLIAKDEFQCCGSVRNFVCGA
jgi:hypothetical protein